MLSKTVGQCVFPPYDSYGLICDQARYLCGYELNGYTGSLLQDKSPQPQPDPLCGNNGDADNVQWFSFIANDSIVEIVIKYSNCTFAPVGPGLQVGIFETCALDVDNSPLGDIACEQGQGYTDIVLKPDSTLIEIGQLYYLFVDGFGNAACDFEIEVVSGICTDIPGGSMQECEQDCGVVSNFSSNQGCTMFRDTFVFEPSSQIIADVFGCNPIVSNTRLDDIICVEWDIQPNTGYNLISSGFEFFDSINVMPTLIVEWTTPGSYTVEPILTFNPLFSTCQGMCECTDDVVYRVDISATTVNQLLAQELCPGECIDFCGESICETGTYECRDRDNCIIEILEVTERPNIQVDQGLFFLCPGECYEFQNVQYCDANSYAISDSASCDTTYLFQLEDLELNLNLVQDDDIINCINTQAVVEGDWSTNFTGNINSIWINETGDTVSLDNIYTTSQDGDYTFIAWPEGMESCAISLTHTITKDDAIPSATLMPPSLDCNNPVDSIIIDSPDAIMSVNWSGPGGFLSNQINPVIDQPGMYEVSIRAVNGCELTLQTEVPGDFEDPVIDLAHDNITCSEEIPVASYTTTADIASQVWTLPDNSDFDGEILNIGAIGNYSVTVTATNGCTTTATFVVQDLSYDPSLQLDEDRIWRCNDTEVILDLSGQSMPGLSYTWTNNEGAVVSNDISLTIESPGVYVLTSVDGSVACVGRDTVTIIPDPNPFVNVEFIGVSPLCEGGEDGVIELSLLDGGTGPYTYIVEGTEYDDLLDVGFEAGNYEIDVRDFFGCEISRSVEVPATTDFIVDTDSEVLIRFGQNKTLTFTTSLDDSEIGSIEWYNEEGEILGLNRELNIVGEPMEYIYLSIMDLNGCEVVTEIKVNLSFEVDIYYPNVFSPNNDGNNDLFVLYNNGFPEMADDLKIYDRSGELVYKSSTTEFNETQVGWDGTFNGQDCQPGVYVFILQYTLMNGRKETISGSITLVR